LPETSHLYQEYYVEDKIAHFIKKLWILNNPGDSPAISNKGVPPNGCFTIASVQGKGLSIKHQDQIKLLPEGVYFCGQITETMYIDIQSDTKAVMIQLFPWTPAHFGISNAQIFTDKICSISEIGVIPIVDLTQIIGLSNERICRYVTKAFYPLFRNSMNTALIIESTQMIIAHKGNIKVSSIASALNCSIRHLQKVFKNHIGISPKIFIRIIKLREVLDDIAYSNISSVTMAELAVANGYYDQPHFNNTFASVIRTTPKNFNQADYLLTLKK
jgi:AraC-like DNA-binding protein